MNNLNFGVCQICGQGQLLAMKSVSCEQVILMCDDCESQWKSPDEASSFENALVVELRDLREATVEEINVLGWEPV